MLHDIEKFSLVQRNIPGECWDDFKQCKVFTGILNKWSALAAGISKNFKINLLMKMCLAILGPKREGGERV